jgi:hypothetical protein
MAAVARARSLAQSVEQTGLQELAETAAFDGIVCIDAMEHVPPEDWPVVVGNLARALRAGGFLYLSLEVMADQEAELERAYAEALAQGMPAVPGESIGEETGGYHFYPPDSQVAGWLSGAGLGIADDVTDMAYDGWGYRHLLLEHLPVT